MVTCAQNSNIMPMKDWIFLNYIAISLSISLSLSLFSLMIFPREAHPVRQQAGDKYNLSIPIIDPKSKYAYFTYFSNKVKS